MTSDVRREHAARDTRGTAIVLVSLVLLAAVSFFVLRGVLRSLDEPAAARVAAAGEASFDPNKLAEPRLQTDAVEDLRQLQANEDAMLSGYAWVDRKKGLVRIPIDRAIDLITQRGLPKHRTTPAPGSPDQPGAPPADQSPAAPPADGGQTK